SARPLHPHVGDAAVLAQHDGEQGDAVLPRVDVARGVPHAKHGDRVPGARHRALHAVEEGGVLPLPRVEEGGIALLHALHVIGGGTAHDPIDDRAAGKEPKLPGELAASAIPYAVALPFALAELDAEAVRIAGDLVRGALPGELALARPPLRSGDPIPPLLHGDLDVSPAGRALLPPRLPPGQRLGRPLAEKLR